MRLYLVILVLSITASIGCARNNPPSPVYGVDILAIDKGDVAPYKGTLFSDFYLDKYLEWKESER